jgi:D-alanyl-D-alanine carboxypeptidase/D-alanyl-D-alanine-endopeptidase (penicillin-binding protein 4)
MGNYYGAGANPFTIYDNMFRITFRSPVKAGEQTKIIATYPKIDGIEITNKVLSSDENRDLAYVYGSPLDKIREIRGTIPKNRKAFTIKAAIHHPEEVLAKVFTEELAKQGIWFSGEVFFRNIDKLKLKVIYIQESPTLNEIVKVLNYESVNLFAEHLVRQIAFEETGNGNRETGIEIIRKYFRSKGLPTEQLFMEDGSGLSHFNAASPTFFTSLLQYMKESTPFVQSLPVAGEGTLYQFNPSLFPDSLFRAKSGSMTRVRCYAGYMKTDSNKELAFSIMVNHFSGSHSSLINQVQNLLVNLRLNY